MLHLQGISKQYGSKVLFENAEAGLHHRSRVALVGPNGAGKTTLLRILLGQESPDAGRVTRASHLSIGHLAQEPPGHSDRTVLEETMRLDGRREELLALKSELEERFAREGDAVASGSRHVDSDALERYGRVLEEVEHLDEYRLEARAKEILFGMGFAERDLARPVTEFSGGWRMRVALARILLLDPDLLLLDEPTNHLDLESLLWLEDFLRSFRGALLLISHDTEFLNRMVTEVIEIDQRKLFSYRGNLEDWARQKQERLELLRSQHASQQARIAEIEEFVARFRAKASKARQAQSRMRELERMERIELPEDRSHVRFRFPPAPHSGREVVTVRKASFSFRASGRAPSGAPGDDKTIFRDLDWTIQRGARVAITGVNGAGKTTLLRLLAGEYRPSAGELKHGHQVQVGYFAQHQAEALPLQQTILQALEDAAPHLPVAQVRGIAGAFLFSGDAVEKKIGVLSGGEKARVALARLLLSPANFLVLDEPTNHLDVESRGVLLEALQDFEGTLCLVSHDRAFVSPLVDSVLEIEPTPQGSRVIPLVGGYEDYLARKQRELSEAAQRRRAQLLPDARDGAQVPDARTGVAGTTADGVTKPSNNQLRAWERELAQLEADLPKWESEQATLQERMSDPATYGDKALAIKLGQAQRAITARIETGMARWEELSLALERHGR